MFRKDNSGPRDPYFVRLQEALNNASIVQPVLLIDRQRLEHNMAQLVSDLPAGLDLRIVAKSLPVPELLKLVCSKFDLHRYMTFNLPMLQSVAELDPQANQLLGKPLPVGAAAQFYASHQSGEGRVYWLIDTLTRLRQYADLAQNLNRKLDIVLELDVGLHRGGFETGS